MKIKGHAKWAFAGAFVIIFVLGLLLAVTAAGYVQITGIILVFAGLIGGLVMSLSGAGWGSIGAVQRPTSPNTAFPAPPPPDTVLVKCPYCGVSQPFSETCRNCGAPLPKPT